MYKRTKIQPVTNPQTHTRPNGQTVTRTHAVLVYVAGAWEKLGEYESLAIAQHWANQYQTNNEMFNSFARLVLHYRKYPIANENYLF